MIRVTHNSIVYYQFASLQNEAGLRHAFFARHGGVSQPPFASLNVGGTVGDDPQAVEINRQKCFTALGLAPAQVVTCYQVHSDVVALVDGTDGGQVLTATDGLVTARQNIALFLRFADCVPILLYDRERQAVGLVHAGWKGTLAGIGARAVQVMCERLGSRPDALWAGFGPAIGACCYEVGPDLSEPFAQRFGSGVLAPASDGRWRLDLAKANELVLREAGVQQVEHAGLCTACRVDEFFSHRREGGRTGRLAAIVALN